MFGDCCYYFCCCCFWTKWRLRRNEVKMPKPSQNRPRRINIKQKCNENCQLNFWTIAKNTRRDESRGRGRDENKEGNRKLTQQAFERDKNLAHKTEYAKQKQMKAKARGALAGMLTSYQCVWVCICGVFVCVYKFVCLSQFVCGRVCWMLVVQLMNLSRRIQCKECLENEVNLKFT